MPIVTLGDGADDRHAVIGRGRGLRGRAIVFRVAATGAVLAGRGAVGVRGAVPAAQLVHDPGLCHQLCTDTTKYGQRQAVMVSQQI